MILTSSCLKYCVLYYQNKKNYRQHLALSLDAVEMYFFIHLYIQSVSRIPDKFIYAFILLYLRCSSYVINLIQIKFNSK